MRGGWEVGGQNELIYFANTGIETIEKCAHASTLSAVNVGLENIEVCWHFIWREYWNENIEVC